MLVLASWIGRADVEASQSELQGSWGPLAAAARGREYDQVLLLSNYDTASNDRYTDWLSNQCNSGIRKIETTLSSPMNFSEIFQFADHSLKTFLHELSTEPDLWFHLSPGTSAMATAWILLAKTKYRARLLQSSIERGVEEANVPFEISAELIKRADERLQMLPTSGPAQGAAFGEILYRGQSMARVVSRAERVASRSVPVLIEGESGTGKELLARAIHRASPRGQADFIAINCGALPKDLVESTLFDHRKGTFTGAVADRRGAFEAADGGTLFLDEVGELDLDTQVKLLRALQEREITRLGDVRSKAVDVRIIAATNREITTRVRDGHFRDDLFYRLAVAVLKIPALRERDGDLSLLIDQLLTQVNGELADDPGFRRKALSSGARNLLFEHRWPGNVRELLNTLRRAALWSDGDILDKADVADAILEIPPEHDTMGPATRPLGEGFVLTDVIAAVATDYLRRGLDEAHGNKSEAARLLGFRSHQTLTNWLRRYGVES
jgi:transcriptional regulator with GAF, ATPase, and Fis domain